MYSFGIYITFFSLQCSPVSGEFLQIVVHVNGIRLPEMNELLQGLVDEDDADERGEGLLREARDVTDEGAGISGHQQQTEERRPQPDTRPEGQIRQPILPANKHTRATTHVNTV